MTSPRPSPLASDLPSDHPKVALGKTGVLMVNLGTPEGTDAASVRRYLAEFLSDRRVVDYPRLFWLPVLYGVILNVRPKKTGEAYAKIWRTESDESPLRYYTRQQAEEMKARLGTDTLIIDWAMRYGVPSIADRLAALKEAGCDRIVIFPLYPQYSATTTATVNDRVFALMKEMAWQPAVRTVPAHHDHPLYIEALAATAREHVTPDTEQVLLSYHGLPERYFKNGDPYHCHCQKTSRLLREKMGWTEEFAPTCFQSKFGPETWLGPATEDLVVAAAKAGRKKIAVMAPAFVSDCIETLEEVGIGLAETFEEHGGETLIPVPCINDSDGALALFEDIIRRETAGWV